MTPNDAAGASTTGEVVDIPGWVRDVALLDAIAAAVVATDTTGKIFYFNRAAERLYGFSADDMLGANVMQLLVEPVDQIPAEEIMATVLAGDRWSGYFRVRRKAGGTAVVRISDTPIREGGRVVGVIGVAEDIADDPSVDQAAVTARIESKAVALADQMRQAMESAGGDRSGDRHVDRGPRLLARRGVPDAVGSLAAEQPQGSRDRYRDGGRRRQDPQVRCVEGLGPAARRARPAPAAVTAVPVHRCRPVLPAGSAPRRSRGRP